MSADRSIHIDQRTSLYSQLSLLYFHIYASLLTHIHMYMYTHVCVYIYTHTVTGEPIDERGPINAKHSMSIHADAPSFAEQSTEAEILVTGIKVLRIVLCRH